MAINYINSVDGYGAADAEYLDGKIVDDDGTGIGTALVFNLHNDIIQLHDKLVRDAGISKNNLPDNETNGYELLTALVDKIQKTVKSQVKVTDVNALTITAFYQVANTVTNLPAPEDGTISHVAIGDGSTEATQMFISTDTDSVYFRRKTLGAWLTWVAIQRPAESFTFTPVGGTGATASTFYARKKEIDKVITISASVNVGIITPSTTTVEFDVPAGVFPFEASGNPIIPCEFVFVPGENTITNKVASRIRLRSLSTTRLSLEYMDETMNANSGLDWIDDESVNIYCNFSYVVA
jgi:hypothetical protein